MVTMVDRSRLKMPAKLAERARALVGEGIDVNLDWTPPPVRDAATVVMVRDDPEGLHVYLQRRVRTMAFAAGMYVFPGGAVEPQDIADAADLERTRPGLDSIPFAVRPAQSPGEDTLAARVAAIRETREETSHDLGEPFGLAFIGHWVTPEVEDRRFDTRFYAAVVGKDHQVRENSTESDEQCWIRPADALAQSTAGQMLMLPPTIATIADFAEQAQLGADAAMAIEAIAAQPIVPLMPSPLADPDDPSGIRWRLVDFRTGNEVSPIQGPPAGSESGGVHTSLGDDS